METQSFKPFIFDFATKREHSSSPKMKGFYSEKIDMWVDAESMVPAIESLKFDNAELNTKTNVDVERDDDSSYFLEMMTKTKVFEESDDADPRACIFNGLLAKTDVIREKDGTSMTPNDL